MFNFNRRDFLKGMAMTAGLSTFGGFNLLAADDDEGKTPKRSFGAAAFSSAAKSFMAPNDENAAVAAIPFRKSLRLKLNMICSM